MKWNKKTLKKIGMILGTGIILFWLFQLVTSISSFVFKWGLIVAAVAGVGYGVRAIFRKMRKGKTEKKVSAAKDVDLSLREMEILSRMADGYTNEQIGEQIFISEHMVDNHISDIYEKLNTNKREEAVKIAQQARLII